MKSIFKIKLTYDQLRQLLAMYEYFLPQTVPEGAHGDLLLEHMILMFQKLINLSATARKVYTLKLNRAEARALTQAWNDIDTGSDPDLIYGHAVILKAVQLIDSVMANELIILPQTIIQ